LLTIDEKNETLRYQIIHDKYVSEQCKDIYMNGFSRYSEYIDKSYINVLIQNCIDSPNKTAIVTPTESITFGAFLEEFYIWPNNVKL